MSRFDRYKVITGLDTSNKQILITALPVFIIGLGITGGYLIVRGACFEVPVWRLNTGIASGGLFSLFIAVVSIIGLFKKIPDWSIIWIAVSLIGFLVMINFISVYGLPRLIEIAIVIISLIVGIIILYTISKRNWQTSGLLGIGLSSSLTLILLFIATNISHNEIKTGYYSALIGLAFSTLIFIYLKSSDPIRILTLIVVMILNGIMIYVFDKSMQKVEQESQLIYLLILSNNLLLIGIILNFTIKLISRIIRATGRKIAL